MARIQGSLLYDVFVLAQAVGEMLDEGLAGAPLRPNEYAVYSYVYESPRCTPTQMREALAMPIQTVSDWVALLRRRGHLVTEPNPADGRSYLVSLSRTGLAAHRETRAYFDAANRAFLRSLATPESDLRGYLVEITDAARATLPARVRGSLV